MINVVIIGHNEGRSVDKMLSALPSEWKIIYVADRCSDDTICSIKRYSDIHKKDINVIDTNYLGIPLEGRQTSFCRNLGLSVTDPDSDVLFMDGDRYVVSGDIKTICNSVSDVTLLTLERDGRNSMEFDIQKSYGTVYNGFFSCGMFIKRSAINKITSHSLLSRKNSIPQLFPEALQGSWGIEDTTLGDICYDLDLSVSLCREVRLRGGFDRNNVDSLDVIEKRFQFRSKLSHVKW